jgi:DNA-binding MarR family transcriptional regulator
MTDLRALFHHLVQLEIELWGALEQRLQVDLDLSMGSLHVMQAITRIPSPRVHDIATDLSVTVGGISKAVDRIEAAGHCVRRPNPQDRRSSIIELTPAGAELLARALVIFDAELDRRLGAVLPEESLTRLSTSLAMLRAAGTVTERINTP